MSDMGGLKKEIVPALTTAGGAAMLAMGNPLGAMLLANGIGGLAGGFGSEKSPGGLPPGGMPGANAPMGPPAGGTPPPIQAAGMPPGQPGPQGPQAPMFAGGPVQFPDPRTSQPGKFTPPLDPALRRMLTGM